MFLLFKQRVMLLTEHQIVLEISTLLTILAIKTSITILMRLCTGHVNFTEINKIKICTI